MAEVAAGMDRYVAKNMAEAPRAVPLSSILRDQLSHIESERQREVERLNIEIEERCNERDRLLKMGESPVANFGPEIATSKAYR